MKQPGGVGTDLNARAHFTQLRRLLKDLDGEPCPQQRMGGGEPADPCTDNVDVQQPSLPLKLSLIRYNAETLTFASKVACPAEKLNMFYSDIRQDSMSARHIVQASPSITHPHCSGRNLISNPCARIKRTALVVNANGSPPSCKSRAAASLRRDPQLGFRIKLRQRWVAPGRGRRSRGNE